MSLTVQGYNAIFKEQFKEQTKKHRVKISLNKQYTGYNAILPGRVGRKSHSQEYR